MKAQKQAIPKTLLTSNLKPTDDHLQAVLAENEIERQWYRGIEGYRDNDQIRADVEIGTLVRVNPDENIAPIMRLRNPELVDVYPPFLRVGAAAVLTEIGRRWRRAMNQAGLNQGIRLAVTSMLRTLDYQATLVEAGKLADPDSVHTRGGAFDMDASGYYLDDQPINARSQQQDDFAQSFKELGANNIESAIRFGDAKLYQPIVHTLLKEVLTKMKAEDKLHFVHEYPGTTNACFHVCHNPEYRP